MILRREVVALAILLLVILILTGSIAATAPKSPILGGLAPILVLAFTTWYLILLIVNRNDIIAALAGILLRRSTERPEKTNFLITALTYAFVIGITILFLSSGLPQRFLGGLHGIIINTGTGNQVLPQPDITPLSNLFPTTPIIYYGMFVFAAIFVVSAFILLRGVHMALEGKRAISEEHETEIELKQEAAEVVQQTIASLKATREYHETILECYKRMCKILSDAGLRINRAETARELAESASSKLRVGRDAVRGLTFLFEEARYSEHRITEEKRIMALNLLESLQQALSMNVGLSG